MPVNKIIISSSDSKYFILLKELYLSLKKQNILNEYDFAVLNTGMNKNQIDYLRDNKIKVKDAIWNTKVPSYKILGRDHLKTQVARAFLPDYFENYKVYIWLDADLWINDLESFLLYEKGALQNNLTITPQSDRAYFNNAKVEWFMNFPTKVKTINFKNISKSVSKKLAKKYQDIGFRTIILPNEPADQLTGLALYSKLQAVTEDVMDILDISLRSTMGGGISYLHNDEETAGPYEKPGWWSDTGPNCSTLPSTGKKIVTLNNPTWKSLDLDWDDGEEPETVIEIKLEKKQEKTDAIGENVVEFKPNDKK